MSDAPNRGAAARTRQDRPDETAHIGTIASPLVEIDENEPNESPQREAVDPLWAQDCFDARVAAANVDQVTPTHSLKALIVKKQGAAD
jgi:hypothetical protein